MIGNAAHHCCQQSLHTQSCLMEWLSAPFDWLSSNAAFSTFNAKKHNRISVLHRSTSFIKQHPVLKKSFSSFSKKIFEFFLSVKQRCSLPQYPAVLRCIASFENKPICIPGLSSSHRLCLVCQKVYGIIKLYGLEGTFKDYLVPTPPSWIGTVSTSPGSSKSHPTRPATLQERGIHIFTGQPAPVSHHSLRN